MEAKKRALEENINRLFGEIDGLESHLGTVTISEQSGLTAQEKDELRDIVESDGYIEAVNHLRKTRQSTLQWADSEMRQLVA